MYVRRTLLMVIALLMVPVILGACDDENGDTDAPSGAVGGAQETPAGPGEAGTPTTNGDAQTPNGATAATVPDEVSVNEDAWPMANKDYANTRADLEAEISSENVDELGVAWTHEIPGQSAYGAFASAPLIADGVVYYQDLASNVFALDLESGEVLWETRYDEMVVGPNGPALGYGRIFVASGVDTLAALDMETGEELWEIQLPEPAGAMQPYVYDGKLFYGTQAGAVIEEAGEEELAVRGYAGGTSGHIRAIDVETGEILWDFMVVEEDFWGNPEVNSGGGVWYPPAIDTDTGDTYWGTGNPAPFPGTVEYPNAESRRPFPNDHTNSIVKLDSETGELEWHNNVNPEDLFDLDFQNPRILASVEINGEEQQIVIGSGKLGRVIAFNPDDGTIIWDTEVGEHQNADLTEIPEGETVTVLPGILGGVETPKAYADGVVYAPVVNMSTDYTADGFGAEDGTEALINAEETLDFDAGTGELVALDASTGDILWTFETDAPIFGGATVVNDLVFTSTYEGMIYALDRESGEEVWSYEAPGGINSWPSVFGDTIIFGVGATDEPVMMALRVGAEPADETPASNGTPANGDAETSFEIITPSGSVFEPNEIRASAGTEITVEYRNDSSLPHNIHFYGGDSPDAPTIAETDVETGPGVVQTVTFTTPDEAGEYFFRCDVHPVQMTGTLIVE